MQIRSWVSFPLAHPRATLGAFLLLSLAWVPVLPRLYLETDGRDLFSPRHPALLFQQEVDETYASSDFLVIGVEAERGRALFAPAPLNAILRLTQRISALPGVRGEEIRSLAIEVSPAWSDGMLRLSPPLEETVRGAAQAAAVRAAALREPSFRGVLVARDGRSTAIYVPLEHGADRRVLYGSVASLIAEQWRQDPAGLQGYRTHLVGPAAAESMLGDHVLTDIARLLPLALLVMGTVFWLWFRQPSIVLVGFGEGLGVVLWTFGLMALLGKPVSLVTVVMPVILSTYCAADTIHFAQCFSAHCRAGLSRREAMEKTLDEMLVPITFTSLTTAVGFLSFAISPIPPLREFGLFSAFGVLFALVVSILVVPAGLLLTGFGRTEAHVADHPRTARALAELGVAAARAPWRVVALTVLVTALLGAGAMRLRIQDSWVQNFDPASPLVRSDRWFNSSFHGSNVLNVVVRPHGTGVHDPAFLAEMARLQGRLGEMAEVGGSLSLVDPLRAVSRSLEGEPRLPRSARESQEWCLLYRMGGGGHSLNPYLDASETSANLWVFLNRADSEKTAAVVRGVERFAWRLPEGRAPEVRLAGDAWLGHLLVGSIARSQSGSAWTALIATFLTVLCMVRSFPSALLAVLPVGLSVLWNFGFMGWAGLPLGVATSTFCAIAFGIGVDFAIHWIARLRRGLESGLEWEEAIRCTGAGTGGAILLQGIVVLLGFAVLLFSSVPPNRYLSLVLCVSLAACLVASLVLLPAVATLLRRRFELRDPGLLGAGAQELSA